MNVAKSERVCGKQSDETIFLLSTSLNSLSSPPVISVSLSSEIHIDTSDNNNFNNHINNMRASLATHRSHSITDRIKT